LLRHDPRGVLAVIVDWFWRLLEESMVWFAVLFPEWSTGAVTGWIGDVTSMLGGLNYFLPIAELFGLVAATLIIFPVFFGATLSLWVWSQVRGSSSRG
jgi:hypothetical protein